MPLARFILRSALLATALVTALFWLTLTSLWLHSHATRVEVPDDQYERFPHPTGSIDLTFGQAEIRATHNPSKDTLSAWLTFHWWVRPSTQPNTFETSWRPSGAPELMPFRCRFGQSDHELFLLGDESDPTLFLKRTDLRNNTPFNYSASLSFRYISAIICLPLLLLAPLTTRLLLRHLYPRSPTACLACGYDLRATPHRCPECGLAPLAPPQPTSTP